MDYYCNVCDKTIEIKSKRKHLQSITHKEQTKLKIFVDIHLNYQYTTEAYVHFYFQNVVLIH